MLPDLRQRDRHPAGHQGGGHRRGPEGRQGLVEPARQLQPDDRQGETDTGAEHERDIMICP